MALGPAHPGDRRPGGGADGRAGARHDRLAPRRGAFRPAGRARAGRGRAERSARQEAEKARDAARVHEKGGGHRRARRGEAGPERLGTAGGRLLLTTGSRTPAAGSRPGLAPVHPGTQALLPADDPQAAPLSGRSVRTWPPRPRPCRPLSTSGRRGSLPRFVFSPGGDLFAMASGIDESRASGPTPARPAGPRSSCPSALGIARSRSPPTSGASGRRHGGSMASKNVDLPVRPESGRSIQPPMARRWRRRPLRRQPSGRHAGRSVPRGNRRRVAPGRSWTWGRIPPYCAGGESRLSRSGRPTRAGWLARWT